MGTKGYRFHQVDVFTDRVFGGNPLAVFPDPEGLDDEDLLSIAREMNLSETTFVYPPLDSRADFRIRIFTPGKEIPFAGHPTLGTAHILWETGRVSGDQDSLVLEMDAGLISVSRREDRLFMKQPQPEFGSLCDQKHRLAEALSLDSEALASRFPAQVVSTGFPALFVPLDNRNALRQIALNLPVLKPLLGDVDMIYPFTFDTLETASTVHSRGFAPFVGIPEDPATGSAGGALGAYLVHHNAVEPSKTIIIEQGFDLKRPSYVHVKIEKNGGAIGAVEVGGQSRTVLEGNLLL